MDVDGYLAGVAHDEVTDLDGNDVVLSRRDGSRTAGIPSDEDFWVATASGSGTQQLDWEATDGRWAVVVMNADGSPGVARGWWGAAGWTLLFNVVLNGYPVMLQRDNRALLTERFGSVAEHPLRRGRGG